MRTLWLVVSVLVALMVLTFAAVPTLRAEEDTKVPKTEAPTAPPAEAQAPTPAPSPAPTTSPAPQPKAQSNAAAAEVCCDDRLVRFLTTQSTCAEVSGEVLPRAYCERQQTVCCKQGRAEWWLADPRSCYADGGVVADESYCR